MKMITGLIDSTSGHIFFNGKLIHDDLIAYKRRMGYVPEEPYLYNHLSAVEYLTMVAQLRELPAKESSGCIDGMLRIFGLYDDRHASISGYSKGMRQKVLISAALLHNPDLVLLDEPFSGLDVGSALILRSLIQELAARGKVVLFSSHELDTVERVCSRIVILHRSKLVADDSIENLRTLMALPTLEAMGGQSIPGTRRSLYPPTPPSARSPIPSLRVIFKWPGRASNPGATSQQRTSSARPRSPLSMRPSYVGSLAPPTLWGSASSFSIPSDWK
jgi:ABC-2 type transport system ATP-binding protein